MTIEIKPRLAAFLAALKDAGDEEFCRPPGLSGLYKVRWIKRGLEKDALAIHRSGAGLCVTTRDTGDPRWPISISHPARAWSTAQMMEDYAAPASSVKLTDLVSQLSFGGIR